MLMGQRILFWHSDTFRLKAPHTYYILTFSMVVQPSNNLYLLEYLEVPHNISPEVNFSIVVIHQTVK